MAEKALSKRGHNCTPKGRSIVGIGSDFKMSVGDDMVGCRYVCSFQCSRIFLSQVFFQRFLFRKIRERAKIQVSARQSVWRRRDEEDCRKKAIVTKRNQFDEGVTRKEAERCAAVNDTATKKMDGVVVVVLFNADQISG